MKRDWMFTVDNSICDLRTVGVLIKDGKILLQRDRGGNEYALPGGQVKIGETLEDGLIREFKEETNVVIGWMPIEEIQNVTIYPEFLKTEINDLNGAIKHFVTKC